MADAMPPPMAPADIICISITAGNTSAMPASASVPSLPTNQVSISPTAACATITSTMGAPRRNSVGTMGPSSSRRVRGSSALMPATTLGVGNSASLIGKWINAAPTASTMSAYQIQL